MCLANPTYTFRGTYTDYAPPTYRSAGEDALTHSAELPSHDLLVSTQIFYIALAKLPDESTSCRKIVLLLSHETC
jgi:hypothetical protein